jgi:predicted dinucleotide-binding enzyme
MPNLTIAVIGTGVIGRTLTQRLAAAGNRVTVGTRRTDDPDVSDFAAGAGADVATVADAIAGADAVILAISGAAMADAVPGFAGALGDKAVIDATNNVGAETLNSIEVIRAHAPKAAVYRAFNTLGWENFADTDYHGVTGDLLYTGPDGPRRALAEAVIGDVGLRPVRVGDNDRADVVDGVTQLWFALALEQGMGRHLGFKVLTR